MKTNNKRIYINKDLYQLDKDFRKKVLTEYLESITNRK